MYHYSFCKARSIRQDKADAFRRILFYGTTIFIGSRYSSRRRLTRVSDNAITSLTLRDVASPRNQLQFASAVAISIAAAAGCTPLRLSINRIELRPVWPYMYMRTYVSACARHAVHIISLQSPAITLIKHDIAPEK